MNRLRLAYYADDFTGATDSLEMLTCAGVQTVLFTSPPSRGELAAKYPELDAIGIASVARSMPVEELDRELRRSFGLIQQLDPALVHYKVCSTFDSSPQTGSIGRAADIGLEIFGSRFVPVLVAAPALGRYVVFGNLFASDGTTVRRLDRHPTMRDHPITPMAESDLRVHLQAQTDRPIGLVDLLALRRATEDRHFWPAEMANNSAELVVFDAFTDEDIETVGRLISESSSETKPQFLVGSSGVEHALTSHWQSNGELTPVEPARLRTRPVDQILVLSASAALKTEEQIRWASDAGWATIRIDCVGLIDDSSAQDVVRRAIKEACDAYGSGRSVVLFTALGPQDRSLAATRERAAELGQDMAELGRRLGCLLSGLIRQAGPQRVCVAGGDTSGHVVAQLSVKALKMISTTVPGAPLCRVSASDSAVEGLEMVLKGGQTGPPDVFEVIRTGRYEGTE